MQVWVGAREEKGEPDIFSQAMQELVAKNRLESFVEHFFNVQDEISQLKKKGELSQIDCDFSLRGKEKLFQIGYTLEKIFPNLKGHARFSKDILAYRCLISLFNKSGF